MKNPLPSLFIGSSTEGLDIAKAVELNLANEADIQVWSDGAFQLGQGTLEGLIELLDQFDFAIMVISPDDLLESREQNYNSPRDNVLFELGLFMGRIGRERTFILHEDNPSLKLPSDLAGITRVAYRTRDDKPQISPACTRIAQAIRKLGALPERLKPKQANIQVFDEVNAAFLAIKNSILKGELKITDAELIQHSSERAFRLASALAGTQANIRLYLQHPATLDIVCNDLKGRVIARLNLYPPELERQKYKGKLQIYLYRTPASFNGIRLRKEDGSSLILLSWYTYVSNAPLFNLMESSFRGSENPCFLVDDTYSGFTHVGLFFDELVTSCEKQCSPPVFKIENGVPEWAPGWPIAD